MNTDPEEKVIHPDLEWLVEKWTQQINDAHANLSEEEKDSNRKKAQKIIDLLNGTLDAVEGNSHMPIVYLKRSKYATDEQYEAILKMFENE